MNARYPHIKFPKTLDQHCAWHGISSLYFHLLIECGLMPPPAERNGEAIWSFEDVDEAILDLGFRKVYFADIMNRGLIKIGYSGNVENRMDRLAYNFNSNVRLMKTIPGNIIVEGCVHKRFEYLSEGDELFWPALELLDYMDAI